jgi:adenylate kinase family enzyme
MASILLLTGPRGCSKSTLGKLTAELGKNWGMVWRDSSAILNLHMQKGTKVGEKLKPYLGDMRNGKVLPGELAFDAIQEWMGWVQDFQEVKHFILPGCTRSVEESACWKMIEAQVRAVHINATEEQIIHGVKARQKETGVVRDDENPEAVLMAIKEHQKKIIPAVKVFGEKALFTHRSKPMRVRLTETVNHMHLPDNIRRRMLNRLETGSHPVCIRVNELDGIPNPVICPKLRTMAMA